MRRGECTAAGIAPSSGGGAGSPAKGRIAVILPSSTTAEKAPQCAALGLIKVMGAPVGLWPVGRQGSSFLKKRSKKLFFAKRVRDGRNTASQPLMDKSLFASFSSEKEESFPPP
jgi:hypothetical protein